MSVDLLTFSNKIFYNGKSLEWKVKFNWITFFLRFFFFLLFLYFGCFAFVNKNYRYLFACDGILVSSCHSLTSLKERELRKHFSMSQSIQFMVFFFIGPCNLLLLPLYIVQCTVHRYPFKYSFLFRFLRFCHLIVPYSRHEFSIDFHIVIFHSISMCFFSWCQFENPILNAYKFDRFENYNFFKSVGLIRILNLKKFSNKKNPRKRIEQRRRKES